MKAGNKKLFDKNSLFKWILVYVVVILFGGYILFPVIWGAAGGIVGGKLFSDPSFQSDLMKRIGGKPSEGANEFWKKLPPDKRAAIEALVKERFKEVNWLPVHLIVNFITFSILGFLVGIILKDFLFSGVIPLVMLFFTLPVLGSEVFMAKNKAITVAVALLTQIVSIYLFSYIGYKIRVKK